MSSGGVPPEFLWEEGDHEQECSACDTRIVTTNQWGQRPLSLNSYRECKCGILHHGIMVCPLCKLREEIRQSANAELSDAR